MISLNVLFESEPIEPITFIIHYLPLLDLPEDIQKEIQDGINKEQLSKSHGAEIVKVKPKVIYIPQFHYYMFHSPQRGAIIYLLFR